MIPEHFPRTDVEGRIAIRGEVARLAAAIEALVKLQPLACFTCATGEVLPGSRASKPMAVRVYEGIGLDGCSGYYSMMGGLVINVGSRASWAEVVEVLTHECCHRFRPIREVHSKEFWALLDQSLQALYGVGLPKEKPPKGWGQYWRDWTAQRSLEATYAWAQARPFLEVKRAA